MCDDRDMKYAHRSIALFALLGCTTEEPSTEPMISSATYALRWDATDMTQVPEGWVVPSLDGEVRISRGYLVTHSVSLAPCTPIVPTASVWPSLFSTAWAGHGEEADASTMPGRVEDVVAMGDVDVGPVSFPALQYCRVHVLMARADDSVAEMPADVEMERISLHLDGHWRTDGGDWVPFEIHTSVNWGVLHQLDEVGDGALGEDVVVEVVRHPGRWFADLAVGELDVDALQLAVVERTLSTADVVVRSK